MSFPRFLSLMKGELYFPNLSTSARVNDPLEGTHLVDPKDLMYALNRQSGKDQPDPTIIATIEGAAPGWLRQQMDEKTSPQYRTNYIGNCYYWYTADRRAISCWCASELESAAMWRGFGESGVAVTIRLKNLQRCLDPKKDFTISAVHYIDRSGAKINSANLEKYWQLTLRPYLVKGLEFEHEKEIRVVTRCLPDSGGVLASVDSIAGYLESVVVSPYVDHSSAFTLARHIDNLLENSPNQKCARKTQFSTINGTRVEFSAIIAHVNAMRDEYIKSDGLPI